jgi:hypothetical protein
MTNQPRNNNNKQLQATNDKHHESRSISHHALAIDAPETHATVARAARTKIGMRCACAGVMMMMMMVMND